MSIGAFAQNKLSDIGRIVLNTYVPEQAEPIPDQAKSLLENKISQITTNYGMGGSKINSRFVLMAKVSVLTKDIIPGPPQQIAQNLDITFYIADALENKFFSNVTISTKGVGTNETKAYIEAIKTINVKNKEFAQFIEQGKAKIVDLYNTQCDFIIREATSLSQKGQYDEAIHKLAVVPDVCERCYVKCMDTMQYIYQQKIDKECLTIIREAKTTWMANQNALGASKVAQILNTISPFSTCEPDAGNLMKEIQTKLSNDEAKKVEMEMKKYNDALELKKEAMRIDEEDRKRSASLQKERQKQDYQLAKQEQEADGFKGLVNSITKLKLTLWRDNSEQYLNTQKTNYSNLKTN